MSTIVIEYRDRFARFGAEYVEAALTAQGRRLLVVDPTEVDDDLVLDVTQIMTSLRARLYSGRLIMADRWYPCSKTCSGCGTAKKTKLALSEREYECEACGLVIDRDRNAAPNLAALAAEFDTAGSGPVAARGADQKTRVRGQVAVKREPGTASAGQTGTVLPQGRTIDRVLTRAH